MLYTLFAELCYVGHRPEYNIGCKQSWKIRWNPEKYTIMYAFVVFCTRLVCKAPADHTCRPCQVHYTCGNYCHFFLDFIGEHYSRLPIHCTCTHHIPYANTPHDWKSQLCLACWTFALFISWDLMVRYVASEAITWLMSNLPRARGIWQVCRPSFATASGSRKVIFRWCCNFFLFWFCIACLHGWLAGWPFIYEYMYLYLWSTCLRVSRERGSWLALSCIRMPSLLHSLSTVQQS